MTKTDTKKVCFDCHSFKYFTAQKNRAEGGYVHKPVVDGNCLVCHGPHLPGKGQSKLLRKDASSLCLDCHAEKAQRQRVNHKPVVDRDCLGCHLPHESAHSGVLLKPQRPLCAECHQQVGEDLGLQSLHRPFVDGRCSACHEPHGGDQKQLLRATGAQNCGQCHGTIETERENARHQPFNQGRCELCHRSHGSQQPFLLERPVQEVCVECHRERRPVAGTPGGHQNCSVCHYSHGNDENAFLLKSPPDLCLNCHNVDRFWEAGVAHAPAAEGRCGSCHDLHLPQQSKANGNVIALCANCHDVEPHTMSTVHKGIAPGKNSCLSCHDPHGGPDASLVMPVKHQPFAKGDCRSCHKGGAQ